MDNTTWRKEIASAMKRAQDPGPIVASTLTEQQLDTTFDGGYGTPNGLPFTAWSPTRVYFPCEYDGSEYVGSAPRHICNEATEHV